MSADSKQKTPQQDEINIIDLFLLLGDFLAKLFRGLMNLLKFILVFLLKKWYYCALVLILTILSGLILSNVLDSYYHSDLVIRSNTPNSQVIISSLNKVGNYAQERNATALSDELNMSPEDASSIKGIEVLWYYDIGDDGIFDGVSSDISILADTNIVLVDSLIIVHAQVYSPSIFKNLETGVITYLNSNPFLVASNQQRIAELEAILNQTDYEIEKLDSLQKREYFTQANDMRLKEGQLVFTNEKTIRLYHNEMFHLLDLKQETERDLGIYQNIVTVVEEFTTPIEPDNGTIYYSKKLVWFFLGIALFISLIITYRKKIWELK